MISRAGVALLVAALLLVAGLTPGTRAQSLTRRVLLPMAARDAAQAPSATGTWEWPNARPIGGAIRAVAAPSESVAWVVGDDGAIARTTDGGATWSVQRSGTGATLYGVGAATPDVAWAVGVGGVILRTTDGGRSWTRQSSNTTTDLAAVAVVSPSVAWVAAGKGTVLRTEDAGATWAAQQTVALGADEFGTHFGIAATSALDAWAVGSEGRVAITHDGGRSWSVTTQPVGPLFGVAARAPNLVWATGFGLVMVSRDGGVTWQRHRINNAQYRAAVILSDTRGWVVGAGGAFLETTDGGATFTNTRGFDAYLTGVVAPSATTAWIAGEGPRENHGPGVVYKTTDGGATWTDQRRRPLGDLPAVTATGAVSPDEAWFVGPGGAILHTSDGGASFRRESSGMTQSLVDVAVGAPRVAWAITENDTILRTEDGGTTWRTTRADQNPLGNSGSRRISAVDASVAWGTSQANAFYRTVDAGRTWSTGPISADPNFIPTDVAALTADTALVAGFVAGSIPGEVHRTTNGGASWTRLYSRIYQPLQAIAALSATTLAVGGGYDLNVSIDAGATWIARCPPDGCATADLAAGASALWASSGGGTFVSTDAGASWARTGPSMQRLAALSERSAWAVRFDQIAHFRD
jgi:photosystem II stability/assembly factor-like uncharacterized protein